MDAEDEDLVSFQPDERREREQALGSERKITDGSLQQPNQEPAQRTDRSPASFDFQLSVVEIPPSVLKHTRTHAWQILHLQQVHLPCEN